MVRLAEPGRSPVASSAPSLTAMTPAAWLPHPSKPRSTLLSPQPAYQAAPLEPRAPHTMLGSRSLSRQARAAHAGAQRQACSLAGLTRPASRQGVARRAVVLVQAHGGPATGLKMAGFVGEMRTVAMKLHTKEQAPKEGGIEAPKPQKKFEPTIEGYARFLAESQVVYQAFEDIMAQAQHPEYARFQHTGLERTAALARDLEWMKQTHGVVPPAPAADGPGHSYAAHLRQLAADDPQFFICHYYNYYFAHTAGGRMIGKKLSDTLLGGHELDFYRYSADVNELLDGVRASLNELAEGWSREQKDHCLDETADAFKYSGMVMQVMA